MQPVTFAASYYNLMNLKGALVLGLFALGAGSGLAQNLIINGNFENVGIPNYSAQIAIPYELQYVDPAGMAAAAAALAPGGAMAQGIQTVNGWTTTGYNFLFRPEDASTATGGNGRNSWNETNMGFWSSAQVGGFGEFTASPAGGNFIALDAAYTLWSDPNVTFTQPLEQTVTGLVPDEEYELSFWWAAAQQHPFDPPTALPYPPPYGVTTEFLTVTFGSQVFVTDTVELPGYTFQGWIHETVRFTATATSMTLSFLAGGGPDGLPPFVLLDGVSLQAVPEPGTVAMLALGVSGCCLFGNRRRKK